jgi:tetratricopeptide (TPR) repeat protein
MLESVREFAYDRLRERGDEDALRRLLAEYCVVLAEAAEPQLEGDTARRWLDFLEAEQDNVRATLSWALERHETALAIRICASMWKFWQARGYLSEGRRWIEQVLAESEAAGISGLTGISESMYPNMLHKAGVLASNQGEYDQAVTMYEKAISFFHQIGDEKGIANCLNSIGVAMHYKSALDKAEQFYEQGLALRRKLDDKRNIAGSLNNLALIAGARQDTEKAIALMEETLEIMREVRTKSDVMSTLYNLGIVLEEKDYNRAVSLYEESLVLAHDLGDKYTQAACFIKLGQASLLKGELEEAEKMFCEGLALSRAIAYKALTAYGLIFLGHAQLRQGDYVAAGATLQDALTMNNELGDRDKLGLCLRELAALMALQGGQVWAEIAVTVYSASSALSNAEQPYTRDFHHTMLESGRSLLGDGIFQSAWDEGHTLTMEAAVELALAKLRVLPTE